MIQWYLDLRSILPLLPPESVPGAQFLLQVLLATIAVAVVCGIAVLVGAVVAIPRRGALGGFLVLVFATPAFVVTGILGWIGGALAIVGGVLALLSSVRPPQKGGNRKPPSS
jgi:ABC-type xylose transport system permease subunit